jgi:hypothetical protein
VVYFYWRGAWVETDFDLRFYIFLGILRGGGGPAARWGKKIGPAGGGATQYL